MRLNIPGFQQQSRQAADGAARSLQRERNAETSGALATCAARSCRNIALQTCSRCGRHVCNQHAYPIEADLPSRWYLPQRPEWLCGACQQIATPRMVSDRY